MSTIKPILCLLILSVCVSCKTIKVSQMDTLSGFNHPESVAVNQNYIFVTNLGAKLEPQQKDGDGYISRFRLNGELMENRFIANLNAPKGTAIHKGVLYVADVDQVRGFDMENGEPVFDVSFAGETTYLNGLSVADDNHLFVSATDQGKIYRINLAQQSYEALDIPGLPGPNGLAYQASTQTLYVVNFGANNQPNGTIGKVTFNPTTYQKISDYEGMLDGARIMDEWLYFTDWKSFGPGGVFMRYNLNTREVSPVKDAPEMAGPADFTLSRDGKFAIIPTLIGNKVLTVKL